VLGTFAELKSTDFEQKVNIFGADALTGLAEVRNVSIAARMEQPRAVETKNFTMATRVEVTQRLADVELDLDEVVVSGVPTGQLDPNSGQPVRGPRKLAEIGDFSKRCSTPSPAQRGPTKRTTSRWRRRRRFHDRCCATSKGSSRVTASRSSAARRRSTRSRCRRRRWHGVCLRSIGARECARRRAVRCSR
jgi:hypothetical protein